MTKTDSVYDLIVIGTGVAASTVAWECHSAGWKIAIIDSRPFGGTCNLRGCDPKKVLVGAAEVIDWNHRMGDKGINNTKDIHIKWLELMRFKRSIITIVAIIMLWNILDMSSAICNPITSNSLSTLT